MTLYPGTQSLPSSALSTAPQPPPDVSIHIQGNNSGNLYVGNRFTTTVGAVAGDLITLVTSADIPLATPRPRPIDGRPRDFAGLIGRLSEIRAVAAALSADEPVELHAGPGMGKTTLLRHLAWRLPEPPDGVYHLRVAGRPIEDLEEQIFAGFFTSQFPLKQYRAQLLEHLRPLRALIILDDVTVDRETLAELLDGLPHCRVLLASEARQLWGDGRSLALPGLSPEEGLTLFAMALGRGLAADEEEPVRQLCIRLGGNPLAIIQAAAAAEQDDRALLPFLGSLPTPTTAAVPNALLATTTTGERQVLAALAALDGAATRPETLAGALGAGAAPLLTDLADWGLVEVLDDGRYRLAAGVSIEATTEQRERLLDYLLGWAQANHANPAQVTQEAEALSAMLGWADDTGRHADVLALARELDAPLTLSGQWATWDEVMAKALHAARAMGDPAGKAWVLHQQGSRALLRGEGAAAQTALAEALAIREQIGDTLGAHLTEYHLDLARYLFPPPPPSGTEPAPDGPALVRHLPVRPPPRPRPWLWPVVLAVVALAVVAGLFVTGVLPFEPPRPQPAPVAAVDGPALRILSPGLGAVIPPGESVWLEVSLGGASQSLPGRVTWLIDESTVIGEGMAGGATIPARLSSGDHRLTARYTGDDGATSEAATTIMVDRRPEVHIVRAGDGDVGAGERVTLVGEARDAEDGDLSADIHWSSNIDGAIGRGARLAYAPSAGDHALTAWVRDAAGNEDEVTVRLVVGGRQAGDQPAAPPAPARAVRPVVRILEPDDGATFRVGSPIRFRAEASDEPDGDLSARIVWRFGTATVRGAEVRRELPPGRHSIIASVADSDGLEANGRVTITVLGEEPALPPEAPPSEVPPSDVPPAAPPQAQPPQVRLGEVVVGRRTANGALVTAAATATDPEEGDISGAISWWTSQQNQPIGFGPRLEVELPPGEHVITALVVDGDGMQAEASRSITVPPPEVANTPPRIEIKRPIEGQLVRFREAVALSASAFDDQEGDLSANIVWWSDIDGELGRGPDVIVDWLGPGLHTIVAEVADAVGAQTRATTSVTVGTDQPDLVAELTQTGAPINADNVYMLVPVRLVVANIGGVAAEAFLVSAGGQGPNGPVATTLVDMPGSDGRRVSIGAGMVPGQRVTLNGLLRIDNLEGLFGQTVSVWVMADNCTGDEFIPPDTCRVAESNEDNNRSARIDLQLPGQLE